MSESRLQELRKKYRLEGGKYEPNPDCKFCKGAGERTVKSTGKMTFCVCLFIEPGFSNEMGTMLGETAKKLKDKIPEMADEIAVGMRNLLKRMNR